MLAATGASLVVASADLCNNRGLHTMCLTCDAGWRTKAQLLVMYGGNQDLVESICRAKEEAGLTRPHPDLPDDPEATLYYVKGLQDCMETACCEVLQQMLDAT